VGNGRSEICWAVATNDGRYAFTTNPADGAVSSWTIADCGPLTLQDAVAGTPWRDKTELRDEVPTATAGLAASEPDTTNLPLDNVTGGSRSVGSLSA
jgi:hypothetical protein